MFQSNDLFYRSQSFGLRPSFFPFLTYSCKPLDLIQLPFFTANKQILSTSLDFVIFLRSRSNSKFDNPLMKENKPFGSCENLAATLARSIDPNF